MLQDYHHPSAVSFKPRDEFIQNIYNRFLNSAQELLCEQDAAVQVAESALGRFRTECQKEKRLPSGEKSMLQKSLGILDREVDSFFLAMLEKIRNHDKRIESRFLKMIGKRFYKNIQNKISSDSVHWDKADVDDVVEESRSIVFEKCMKTEFKGLFIQWAQAVLNNKYRETRRRKIRLMLREKHIEDETFEKRYSIRLSDRVGDKRAREVGPEEIRERTTRESKTHVDPFEGDSLVFEPDVLLEAGDLKEQLLMLVKRIKREACAKVFSVLFSEGDRKFMHEQFPDRTSQQIDLLISQCRQQLKTAALNAGIL